MAAIRDNTASGGAPTKNAAHKNTVITKAVIEIDSQTLDSQPIFSPPLSSISEYCINGPIVLQIVHYLTLKLIIIT